jgi:ActR/RegA family two-component response regulator
VLVAVTGFGQQEDRRRAFAAGSMHHLVRPANLQAIEAILMSLPERAMSSVGPA